MAVTNIEGQAMSIGYFVGNMVSETTRFDGSTVSNTYDQAGRLGYVQYGSASVPLAAISYEYYPDGEIKTVSDGFSSITNSFDRLNRLVGQSVQVGNLQSEIGNAYNAVGNLTNTVVSIGNLHSEIGNAYAYDAAERLAEIVFDREGATAQRFIYSYSPETGWNRPLF